jgi:hypothetical protein
MRLGRYAMLGGAAGAALGALAPGAAAQQGGIICSVFDPRPCAPTVCPLDGEPCQPQYPFPLGENLQLTIKSADSHAGEKIDPEHEVDTIHDLFVALRACWLPPEQNEAHAGMQMSVRFAFNRNGAVIGQPRLTYATPGVDDDTRQNYRHAINDALGRCTPMPFSKGMAGAIAGRPIAIRYVEDRKLAQEHGP